MMRLLSVFAVLIICAPLAVDAQGPIAPLPPKPIGPVQSNQPPKPPPTPQTVPTNPPVSTKKITWEEIKKLPQSELGKYSQEDLFKMQAMGFDPPFQFRPYKGTRLGPTGQFEKFATAVCDPSGLCKNSTGARPNLAALPPGYQNPNLSIPEIPWKDVQQTPLPCGAIGGLSEIALQTLWGNAKINMPPEVKTLINGKLKDLLGKLFGKKVDCQDGTFWATLSNLINVILPKLKIKGPGFIYDRTNNTFLAPPNTLIALPPQTTLTFDPSAGSSYFLLPVGGSFYDGHGKKIVLTQNVSVQFTQGGNVMTSDGGTYSVSPGSMVTLDPNGVLGVPAGTAIPVPPETTLFPMGSKAVAPEWAKNPPLVD